MIRRFVTSLLLTLGVPVTALAQGEGGGGGGPMQLIFGILGIIALFLQAFMGGGSSPQVGTPIEEQPAPFAAINPTQTGGTPVSTSGGSPGGVLPNAVRPSVLVSENGLNPASVPIRVNTEVVFLNPVGRAPAIKVVPPLGVPQGAYPARLDIPLGGYPLKFSHPGVFQILTATPTGGTPVLGTITVVP